MARSSLSSRLSRIRESRLNESRTVSASGPEQGNPSPADEGAALPEVLAAAGWKLTEDKLFARTLRHGFTYGETAPGDRAFFSDFPDRLSSELELFFPRETALFTGRNGQSCLPDTERLRFFDIETTGLSRGAGTVAFMLCSGRFEGGEFIIDQLILPDYDREPEFLAAAARLLTEQDGTGDRASASVTLVSFNGKCFDSQILQTRYLMNGIRPPQVFSGSGEDFHLDLLYPSRRLWGKLFGSCRLSVLEERLLGTPREDDLPGSMAPEAWFTWLRAGDADMLFRVGEHNRDDCITMPRILALLNRIAEAPLRQEPVDYHSLGALFLASGRNRGNRQRLETGEALLRRAVEEQNSPHAALLLASHLRRSGLWREAEPLLLLLAEEENQRALLMLAIDAEHRKGDYHLALSLARRLNPADDDTIRRTERLIKLTALYETET